MSTRATADESVTSSWSASRDYQGTRTVATSNTEGDGDGFSEDGDFFSHDHNVIQNVSVEESATGYDDDVYRSEWGASMTEMAWGWTAGGGVSFAVTGNLIWTTEGYYYDLGEHSIRAKDSNYGTTYEISQRFNGYLARTGVEWKF